MIKLLFWPQATPRTVRCRRGKNTYREQSVPLNSNVMMYPALTHSVLELVDNGRVVGTVTVGAKLNGTFQFSSVPLSEADAKNAEPLQQMVRAEPDNGRTFSGTVPFRSPSMDEGNARLGSSDECGSKECSNGVLDDDSKSESVSDRHSKGICSLPVADKDTGRNRLLRDSIRSSVGVKSETSDSIQ